MPAKIMKILLQPQPIHGPRGPRGWKKPLPPNKPPGPILKRSTSFVQNRRHRTLKRPDGRSGAIRPSSSAFFAALANGIH